MALQTLTLEIPDSLYKRLVKLAKQSDTPVATETVNLLASAMLDKAVLAPELEDLLKQLSYFTNEELLQAAKMSSAEEDENLMQNLLEKQQREGLNGDEQSQAENLSAQFNRIMLIRAQAGALLVKRGYEPAEVFPEE